MLYTSTSIILCHNNCVSKQGTIPQVKKGIDTSHLKSKIYPGILTQMGFGAQVDFMAIRLSQK